MTTGEKVTKAEFARLINVSRGRVTQMINEGKISGDALDVDGVKVLIVADLAKAQIRDRTDIGQSFGNGATTLVDGLLEKSPEAPPPARPQTERSLFEEDMRRVKLESARQQLERQTEEALVRRGTYVRADGVAAAQTKLAVQMLSVFEGAIPELANALAARFSLPQRDVLHALTGEFRAVREKIATTARRQAADIPGVMEDTSADALSETQGSA